MKITYLAHASFLIEFGNGTKVLTDPYDASVGYTVFDVEADIVTTSHKHYDHAYTNKVKGDFTLIDKEGHYDIKGIKIQGIKAYHDNVLGKQRGENIIFTFESRFKVAHLGDLGHTLSTDISDKLGQVDILLIPVGGVYTIDAKAAYQVVETIKPKIVIPMHYKTEKLKFDLGKLEDFTRYFQYVDITGKDTIEIDGLPNNRPYVYVLKHRG
ncbi:MBL fold metallo-hydrolase [Caldicellulosiruptoraceae bacterium PP1]